MLLGKGEQAKIKELHTKQNIITKEYIAGRLAQNAVQFPGTALNTCSALYVWSTFALILSKTLSSII